MTGSFKNLPKGAPAWKKMAVVMLESLIRETKPKALKKHAKARLTKKNIHVGRTLKKVATFGIFARIAHPYAVATLVNYSFVGTLLEDFAKVAPSDHLAYLVAIYASGLVAILELIKYQLKLRIKFIL